ncbi:transaldolase family protein [Streptomyces gamaensis]|uniref:Transaldolase family protein n=1 Tax=Streptomyces gamaensis TaxID=1763542 RepID=A0ABW0Z0Q3_9ACTN
MTATLTRPPSAATGVWLDDAGRDLITTDGLRRLVHGLGVRGLMCTADATTEELRLACGMLSARGVVSAAPVLHGGADAGALLGEARLLHRMVARPNLLVRLPAALWALPVVTRLLAEGIGVHTAWIGSPARYEAFLDAFHAGLSRVREAGGDLAAVRAVASVPVRHIDAAVDGRLDAVGGHETAALRGRAGRAVASLAHHAHQEFLASARWRSLAAAGAVEPRLVWSLGGPPSPADGIRDRLADLAAPDTAAAVPASALTPLAHGLPEPVGSGPARHREDARRVVAFLDWYGVSAEDAATRVEGKGLARMLPGSVAGARGVTGCATPVP